VSESGIAPTVSESNSGLQLSFRRSDLSQQSPVATITIEISEDLTFTTPDHDIVVGSSSDAGPIGPLGVSYSVTNSDGYDQVTVTIPTNSIAQNFVRLVVTQL
jgi:hypothetical protein